MSALRQLVARLADAADLAFVLVVGLPVLLWCALTESPCLGCDDPDCETCEAYDA